jgi:pimeloyl-ACP methyl ester carboxylesterase
MLQVTHHTAHLRDLELHYVTAGAGDPVVLLHGWPQTWYAWRHVIPGLAADHLVVTPDLRGLGDSARPASGFDKRTIADDIWQLLHDKLGLTRWSVIGHDWGGAVAYALASTHRDEVERLAVLDVTIPGDGQADISQNGRRWHHGLHRTLDLPEQLVAGREDVYLGWFYANYGHRSDAIGPADVAEYLRTYRDPGALHAGFEYYRAIATDVADNEGDRDNRLQMPVLAIGGLGGWGRGSDVAASLRQLADDVHEVVLPDCGHWIPEEQPDALLAHLLAFLDADRRP